MSAYMSELRQYTSDGALWEAIKSNDAQAFKTFYDRYWQTVFTTAFSYLRDRAICIEIVQDIFLSIWLKRDKLEMDSIAHYLRAAARYQVYKQLRQKNSERLMLAGLIGEADQLNTRNEGENNLHFGELQAMVDRHLQHLPQRCREIFILSRREHLSIAEISEKLGISRRTVENQLTRALQHLRESLGNLSLIFLLLAAAGPVIGLDLYA